MNWKATIVFSRFDGKQWHVSSSEEARSAAEHGDEDARHLVKNVDQILKVIGFKVAKKPSPRGGMSS